MSLDELEATSKSLGAKVASLKNEKAEKAVIDAAVAELLKAKGDVKAALEEALAAAAGDAAKVAEIQAKIDAATPRPSTKKQPKAEQPKAEQPKADKPKADKPKADKPKADKPAKKGGDTAAPAPKEATVRPASAGTTVTGLGALADLVALNAHMATSSYVQGSTPTQADVSVLRAIPAPTVATPHALRWYTHMLSFSDFKLAALPGTFVELAPAACAPCAPASSQPVATPGKPGEGVCKGPHPAWYPPSAGTGQRVTGLRVHNSLTSEKELFVPMEGNKVTWYTCGPTVYDACHMGHARAYLTMDILRRVLEDYFGYEVFLQVNVTDVDDKIIARARKNKLLADFIAGKEAKAAAEGGAGGATLAAVRAEVSEATAKFGAKMDAKLKKLEVPLQDRREEEERATLLEQHKQKLQPRRVESWAEARKKIEAACAAADGTVRGACEAAAEPMSDTLDAALGATVTQHEIFNAHSRRRGGPSKQSRGYEAEFIEDLQALNIRMPDALSRVTEYVDDIVRYVKQIVDKGFAYESNGSVYMDIGALRAAKHDYPKLEPSKGKATAAEMEESEGAHTAAAGEKRNAADFALWKKSKGGEPSWDSPWGGGRPGWHIECSVMASDLMGGGMDVHAGGSDLKFPHHDNELAQSEAYHGCQQWVNYFWHFGHLHIKGLKMSKSLKNFITIRQALGTHTARQIRLMFLLQPWDKPMNFSDQTIEEARARETSFKSYFAEVKQQLRSAWLARPTKWDERAKALHARMQGHMSAVHECLCDNFNTPGVMAALLAIVSDANSYVASGGAAAGAVDALLLKKGAVYVTRILRVFGVATQEEFGFPVGAEGGGGNYEEQVSPLVSAMVEFRDDVRKLAKGAPELMKACDQLRDDKLTELGVRVEDRADGARWTLDNPETLRKEQEAKRAAVAETRVQKVVNKLGVKQKDLAKVRAALVPADQLLREPPHAAKYQADSFDAAGKPSADAAGNPLSKSMLKEVEMLYKKQLDAHAKQKAAIEKSPDLVAQLEEGLATLLAEAQAVLTDGATMAVLSEELVAQLKAAVAP